MQARQELSQESNEMEYIEAGSIKILATGIKCAWIKKKCIKQINIVECCDWIFLNGDSVMHV